MSAADLGAARIFMTDKLVAFVDTNVLVYAFDRSHPRRREVASRLIESLAEHGALRTSTQILNKSG